MTTATNVWRCKPGCDCSVCEWAKPCLVEPPKKGKTMKQQENFDRIVNALSVIPRDVEYLPDITLASTTDGHRFVIINGNRIFADGLHVRAELGPNGLTESKLAVSVHIEAGHGTFETEYTMARDAEAIAKGNRAPLPEDDPNIDTRDTADAE